MLASLLLNLYLKRSEKDAPNLRIYDASGPSQPIHKIEKLHKQPVHLIKFNWVYDVIVSTDKNGMVEYWSGPNNDYKFPKNVLYESKMETDLYEFVKVNFSFRHFHEKSLY